MRRLSLAAAGAVAVVVLAGTATPGSPRTLPLQAPAAASPLLALWSDGSGSRLEQVDPSSLAPLRGSRRLAVGASGWAVSPGRRLIAIDTYTSMSDGSTSTLRFADAATLRFARQGVRLDGYFVAASWPTPGRLYALTGGCCGTLTVETVDTVAKRIVARVEVPGAVATVGRSADGLVALVQPGDAIGPAALVVVGGEGDVRSVGLPRILAGTHVDESSSDPIATTRQPGLAVDAAGGTAYVLDPDGLVAKVRLGDLAVSYHEVDRSLLARLSAWLTPPAQAKGLDGPVLAATWLGDGLIAVTGTQNSTVKRKDGSPSFSTAPFGLRVLDTHDWSERTLDPQSDTAVVADGLLLASGGTWRTDSSGTGARGEGLAAYGPDGTLRWRLDPGKKYWIEAVLGSRALVQAYATDGSSQPLRLVDLATGSVVGTLPVDAYPSPLVGSGS